MAMSSAERQRSYRERMKSEGVRINMIVSPYSAAALDRLARHNGTSKKDALEQLIRNAEEAVLAGMVRSSKKTKAYYGDSK